MAPSITLTALVVTVFLTQRARTAYVPQTTLSGASFFEHFTFSTAPDPTQGFVTYISSNLALASSMIGLSNHSLADDSVYIGVDATNVLPATGPGRNAVRLEGKESFTHGLITLDVYHAPTGCGLWPAIWMVNGKGEYPGTTGEIDIFEGVHDMTYNSVTLHTGEGCKISNDTGTSAASNAGSDTMLGSVETMDCWVNAPEQTPNQGCSIAAPSKMTASGSKAGKAQKSYSTAGEDFNSQGGGVYALLWTSTLIEAYFFPRPLVPAELKVDGTNNSQKTADPQAWKQQGFVPVAKFEGCDFDKYVSDLSLVINTDFCGGWAGGTWESSGCAAKTGVSTCDLYVGQTPGAFRDAYWLLSGVQVWKEQ